MLALRLRTLLRRQEVERDLDDEIRYHIEQQTQSNAARGMNPVAARQAALVAFGGASRIKEDVRDQLRPPVLAELTQDLRYGWRMSRRAPVLTAVVVATIGFALALATSAFSAVNGVLLRSLPYRGADRLALIWDTQRDKGTAQLDPVSFTNAMDWRRDVRGVQSLAVFSCTPRPILATNGSADRTTQMEVSPDFFDVIGASPLLGRLFEPSDFAAGAPPVVVITHSLWQQRLSASPNVVSTRVLVDGVPSTVIGVLRPDFAPLPTMLACHPETYRPLPSRYDDSQRSWSFLKTIARLAPGATIEGAQRELDVESARLSAAFPEANRGHRAVIVGLGDYVTRPLEGGLLLVQAGALFVLLIACANIAGLMLTRAAVRQRELAIRVALGASRLRLARQLATECGLLGVGAFLLGGGLTAIGMVAIARQTGDAFPDPRGLSVDWRVLVFSIVASLAATIMFTIATVAAAFRGRGPLSSLRDGGRTSAPGAAGLRRVVVAGQLALATIVLVGAGLLARSYVKLRDVRSGFDPTGVTTARVTLPDTLYPRGERQVRFFGEVLNRISRVPGVIAAGAVSVLPESPNFDRTNAKAVGRTYPPGEVPTPDVYRVTPGYFDAMGIPLDAGRRFTSADDDRHPLAAIINETMARAFFPGESAVRKRIWTGAGQAERTVVGVVGDTYQYGLDRSLTMQLYVPHADNSGGDLTLVVRTASDDGSIAARIREAVRDVDPGVPVDEILTMNQVLSQSAARRRVIAQVSIAFAVGAIALAALGLYGVIAFGVSARTPEIGLRMALGATGRAIIANVAADVGRIVIVGMVVGLSIAAWLATLLSPLLFGVSARDPLAFWGAGVALTVVAVLAALLPAVRAARVSPAIALRTD
jgi:putative ABC transport system permease protein